MPLLKNPFRHQGLPASVRNDVRTNIAPVLALLKHCPVAHETTLHDLPSLAGTLGVGHVFLKDERHRMRLGSFKATGATYVIAATACRKALSEWQIPLETLPPNQLKQILRGQTYICASAGNHGLSVAAAARIFGATAVIYLSHAVPQAFADRLNAYGAEVMRAGHDYDASMAAASAKADAMGWTLLSDSAWSGYTDIPSQVMQGYLIVADEVCQQIPQVPSHIFLQAGVGGLAAAMTAYWREKWGQQTTIVIVEPDVAPAIFDSIRAGQIVVAEGATSIMGRLDCKVPSLIALNCLAREADWFVTISDTAVQKTTDWLEKQNLACTPSAAAGLAVVQQSIPGDSVRRQLALNADSSVLAIISEQA